ncbi:MAG TPA: methyltransferase domain-containing protein [Solirubrobacteraceae bacterium]|nr:methyltransferase domain-containing protein [Solirubrobacteraceae bacterium]
MKPRATVAVDPEAEERELREYLGARYEHLRLQQWAHQLDEEFRQIGDEQEFYRRSEGYLYNLTAFAMSRTKVPYLQDLVRLCPPPARLLDYGCGIGSDGLALSAAGYDVSFADFDNPSTRYLRWRLQRRGLDGVAVYDLDRDPPPGGFDLAFAFDVLEHVADPFALLDELERRARIVLVNVLEPVADDVEVHHRELPVQALIDHATTHGLRRHRRYHGRVHLLGYAPCAGGGAETGWLASRVARIRARLPALP